MNSSLSVLLPVHNAQSTLQANVQRLLDILPELTGRFELLIVDDGSTDATSEVAYELARDFPQIAVIRHAGAIGWAASVARQAERARGDFLMIHGCGPLETDDVAGLWRLRQGIAAGQKATARTRGRKNITLASIAAIRQPARKTRPTLGIHARASRSNLLMIHRKQLAELEASLAAMPETGWPAAPRQTRRHGPSQIKAPTFLGRVKKFALDE